MFMESHVGEPLEKQLYTLELACGHFVTVTIPPSATSDLLNARNIIPTYCDQCRTDKTFSKVTVTEENT